MKQHKLTVFGIAFLLLPFVNSLIQKVQADAISDIVEETCSPPPVPAQEQPEVLTRGPVHEAFAEPVSLQMDEGLVTSKQPPASIEEIPQQEKPAGGNFVWVPGYWSWEGERGNYIWVSGCWRLAPPKMSWVSGYWTRVNTGWKWVSGFWMQNGNNEIEYLKAPPATVEIEPVGTPPTSEYIWVPGCWYWSKDRYVSRPGYWLQGHSGWVWIPSHYVWTPRGYVFSSGHWDYTIERRGVLFAPVYFPSSVVYTRPGFRYSLGVTVDLGLLKVNLFCSPRYSHYYFGDYYDDISIRVGIFPCFESVRRHTWYDPIYQYDRWHSRDSRWDEHEKNSYELRRNNRNLRPAKTYREQEIRMSKLTEGQRNNFQIIRTVNVNSSPKSESLKTGQSNNDIRQKIIKQSNDVNKYRDERRQWESAKTNSKIAQPSEVRVKDATQKMKTQSSAERVNDENHRIPKSPENTVSPVKQPERIKDPAPKSVQSPVDRYTTERSERVKVPESPVSDRVQSYTNREKLPSTPIEERRNQDDTRDMRRDDGQRGKSRDNR